MQCKIFPSLEVSTFIPCSLIPSGLDEAHLSGAALQITQEGGVFSVGTAMVVNELLFPPEKHFC